MNKKRDLYQIRLGVFAPFTHELARKISFEKSWHPPEA
jgi:hypothetical protein